MMVSHPKWKVRGSGGSWRGHAPHMTSELSVSERLQVSAAVHASDWPSPKKGVYEAQQRETIGSVPAPLTGGTSTTPMSHCMRGVKT